MKNYLVHNINSFPKPYLEANLLAFCTYSAKANNLN